MIMFNKDLLSTVKRLHSVQSSLKNRPKKYQNTIRFTQGFAVVSNGVLSAQEETVLELGDVNIYTNELVSALQTLPTNANLTMTTDNINDVLIITATYNESGEEDTEQTLKVPTCHIAPVNPFQSDDINNLTMVDDNPINDILGMSTLLKTTGTLYGQMVHIENNTASIITEDYMVTKYVTFEHDKPLDIEKSTLQQIKKFFGAGGVDDYIYIGEKLFLVISSKTGRYLVSMLPVDKLSPAPDMGSSVMYDLTDSDRVALGANTSFDGNLELNNGYVLTPTLPEYFQAEFNYGKGAIRTRLKKALSMRISSLEPNICAFFNSDVGWIYLPNSNLYSGDE